MPSALSPMHRTLRAALVATLLIVGGCTTLRPVAPLEPRRPVAAGDRLVVTTTDHRRIALTVDQVTTDGWVGRTADGERVEIERAEAATVERRERSAFKTIGLVLSIVLVEYLYLALVVF